MIECLLRCGRGGEGCVWFYLCRCRTVCGVYGPLLGGAVGDRSLTMQSYYRLVMLSMLFSAFHVGLLPTAVQTDQYLPERQKEKGRNLL